MINRIKELVEVLNYHAHRYYVLDDPQISDSQYDKLYDELVELEHLTGLILPYSPTTRVGGEPVKAFGTHKHIARLYSLDKCKTTEELRAWAAKIDKIASNSEFTAEFKLDGLTLCVTYDNGHFVRATTRGNGETGEDVTAQARVIRSVPLSVPYKGLMEVQGEVIMRLSVLEEYNRTATVPLKNARNGAAGAIRNLDPKITAARRPDVIFYNINYIGNPLGSQEEMFEFLRENGFRTTEYFKTSDIDALCNYVESADRTAVDFLVDGMVIKINSVTTREDLGFTDRFPRWAIAYKFESEEVTTVVRGVEWNVGRTGKVTPLALLEPVELGGVTISRATLNNAGDISRKNVKRGGSVFLRRSNDVIPEIMGAADEAGEEIITPDICPECGATLLADGAHIFCRNTINCPAQAVGALEHFASKDCMDIEGLSEKTCELLYAEANVRNVADLYALRTENLLLLDGFAGKRAENLIAAIQKSKSVSLHGFINALGIPNIGKKTARDLAEIFGSISGLVGATRQELVAIPEVGEVMADSIISFFERNSALVERLIATGINPVFQKTTGALTGKKFVLTGSLPTLKRSEAASLIEKAGGTVAPGVSKEISFVIAGEDAGSKLTKARTLGIPVIDEAEFLQMLKQL